MQVPTGKQQEYWFYLEEAKSDKPLVSLTPGKILLFFKFYEPFTSRLAYLGRCYAHGTNSLPALMPFLYKKTGLPTDTILQVSATRQHSTDLAHLTHMHCQCAMWQALQTALLPEVVCDMRMACFHCFAGAPASCENA